MNVSWFFSGLDYLQGAITQYFPFLTFEEKTQFNHYHIKHYYDFENLISTLSEHNKIDSHVYANIISHFFLLEQSPHLSYQNKKRLGILDSFHALANAAKEDPQALYALASLTDKYEDHALAYATAEGYRIQGKHAELMIKYYHLATVYHRSSLDEETNYVSLAYERLSELYQKEGMLPQSDIFAKHFKFKAACYDEALAKTYLAANDSQLKMEEKAVFFLQKGMVYFYQEDIDSAILWLKKAQNYRNKTPSAYEEGLFNDYYKIIGDYYVAIAISTVEQEKKDKYFKLGADAYLQISKNANNYIALHLEAANLYAECLNDKNSAYDILVKVDRAKSNSNTVGKFSTTADTIGAFFELPGKMLNYYNYLKAWMSKWRNGLNGAIAHEFVEPFNKNRDNPIDGYLFYKDIFNHRRKYIMSHARVEKKQAYTAQQIPLCAR